MEKNQEYIENSGFDWNAAISLGLTAVISYFLSYYAFEGIDVLRERDMIKDYNELIDNVNEDPSQLILLKKELKEDGLPYIGLELYKEGQIPDIQEIAGENILQSNNGRVAAVFGTSVVISMIEENRKDKYIQNLKNQIYGK